MKFIFLIIIPILLGCSSGNDKQSTRQIDSLTSIIISKNVEISELKDELTNSQEIVKKLEDDQLKSKMTEQSDCKCNIDYVRIAKQSIPNLTEYILLGLLCTFSDQCKNNAEFGQFSNATMHEIISKQPELFISTVHENSDKINVRTILNEVKTPVHDGFDLQANYQSIKEIYGYDSTKDSVLTSIEISMDKANINYFKGDDCIFDPTTQTDEFLQGIPELENYVWNKHINTAKIQLAANETLYVSRGGCNHFGASADFLITEQEIDFEQALQKII